jgi:hypothetical protein
MDLNTIILGTTGIVGEEVLYECFNHSNVNSVEVIIGKP